MVLYWIIFLVFFLLNLNAVSAYIDPGTGGMILSSIGATIWAILCVIGAFFVGAFFKPIKRFFLKIFRGR